MHLKERLNIFEIVQLFQHIFKTSNNIVKVHTYTINAQIIQTTQEKILDI